MAVVLALFMSIINGYIFEYLFWLVIQYREHTNYEPIEILCIINFSENSEAAHFLLRRALSLIKFIEN